MRPPRGTCETFPLGHALEFLQRLWRLNHELEKLSSRMEQTIQVSAQQRFVVRCIGKHPGVTAGQLARLLHVDPGTVSAALNRLEDKGLLIRKRDPSDRRKTSLGLTERGRKLNRPAKGTVESAVERLLKRVRPGDIEAFDKVLAQLTVELRDEMSSLSSPQISVQPLRRARGFSGVPLAL